MSAPNSGGKDGAKTALNPPPAAEPPAAPPAAPPAEQPATPIEGRQNGQNRFLVASVRQTRGPLPSPEVFKAYPEAVQIRIVENFAQESEHRREKETAEIRNDYKTAARGQHYTLIVVLFVVSVSGFLIYNGHGAYGALLITGLVSTWDPVLKRIGAMMRSWRSGGRDDSA